MKTKYFILSVLVFCVFTIYGQQSRVNNTPARHYSGIINSGNNMTIGIPDYAWENMPVPGDEIGAFNNRGELVGSCIYNGNHVAIAVWGDDETTKEQEGVQSGDRFIIKLWSQATGTESVIEVENWIEGDDIYKANGISIVGNLKTKPIGDEQFEYTLMQNVPNPVRDITDIEFSIPRKAYVEVSLYTASGEFVQKIFTGEKPAGKHNLKFDTKNLASGTYCYKMTTGDFSATKNMNIIR